MAVRAAETSSTPEPSIGYVIADLMRLLRRDFYAQASGLGLTPALARLLFYVHREPGCRQSELAARLEVTPVTLSRMIDRLVARRYVTRRLDAADRRAVRITVAARGEPLVARLAQIVEITRSRALRGLAQRERKVLYALLDRLRANLTAGA